MINGTDQINKKITQGIRNEPPPFCATILEKRQMFPVPTAIPIVAMTNAHRDENLAQVMCRSMVSVDWQGYLYDCDFNQMLDLAMQGTEGGRLHLADLLKQDIKDAPITVRNHCYACTAGQGSSCAGALYPSGQASRT